MVNVQYTFGRTGDTMLEPPARLTVKSVRPAVLLATPHEKPDGTSATTLKESAAAVSPRLLWERRPIYPVNG
jgi:hypothetical protein